ncbi:unnamed protein product, partial [Iphiclides podalirius]
MPNLHSWDRALSVSPRRAATLLWWRGLRVLMTSKAMPDRVSHTGQARSEGPDEEQHKEGLSVASDATVGGDFANSSFRNQRLTSTTLLVAPVGDVVCVKEDGPLTSTTVGSLEEVGGISASDSGSEMSLELEKSVASNASFASMGSGEAQRVRKKRTRASDADAEADDHPESSAFKRRGTPVPKRCRGRPPNSGQYLGLAKGKRELMEARRAEMELQAEKEVPELIQRRRLDRALRPAGFDDVVDFRLSSTLLERVDDVIKVITKVATKSKNLKGTFVKALKKAAEMIREAVNALQSISSTDETRRLQADNKRLRDEVATLQKEA